jgi:anti-sigma regulatory factor (Ser/Thr protein kinase)/CheY-like chemotaxis protein
MSRRPSRTVNNNMDVLLLRALIIEDSPDDLMLVQRELRRGGFDLVFEQVETALDMSLALDGQDWDVILCDFELPGFGAAQALALLQATGKDIPFLIVSGTIGEETAVEMMRAGAADFLIKGRLGRLVPAIRRELQEAEGRRARRQAEVALRERERENEVMQKRFRAFMHDVLSAVTGGKLHLCDVAPDLPASLGADCALVPLETGNALRGFRKCCQNAAQTLGFTDERCQDLITAASEAGMNVVVHGGGGQGRICHGTDTVQVWIEDHGKGIAFEQLPRATLEKGYTTAGTLGYGMKMMLQTVDRVWLLTGLSGTTIVLEQDRDPNPHALML